MATPMARITNIQRFSLNDGPGIRTTVFFKGCRLKCRWCHNPECIAPAKQLQFEKNKCRGCGACVNTCSRGVHKIQGDRHDVLYNQCVACGKRVQTCVFNCLSLIGNEYTAQELIYEVMRDMDFYTSSGGGVTFSGGEPLLQAEFLKPVMQALKREDVHLTLDTCGEASSEALELLLPYTDLVLYDIKSLDSALHKALTGIGNRRIVANLAHVEAHKTPIWVRMPLIKDLNDKTDMLEETANWLCKFKMINRVEILPYHRYGEAKYEALGMAYSGYGFQPPAQDELDEVIRIFRLRGLNIVQGG